MLSEGVVIKEYPDDTPYQSCLLLGFVNNKPIHVVFAVDDASETGIVITAYIPDPKLWTEDFKSRRNTK